ncbi:CCR4-NOT transcription complex subunit 3 [Linum perenne]
MGASRKLQGEIDRVLKKVQEGVDVFDSIWNKVYDTDNANQKEKFEADLKKEIKKLQRYRDQIKTWIQSSEIKDKKVSASYEQALMDARKLIEREMERFKICEKETKTKAFSKEGLGQQPKTDPREKAKSETRDWLNNLVSELESQIDSFEAEMEGLTVKKGKTRPPRLTHLETSIQRHKAHIMKLELILRLLDNDELSAEQVNDVKDFIDDYVERNQEDFDEFSDVDELYSSLPLDKVESLEDLVAIVPPGLVKGAPVHSLKSPSASSPAPQYCCGFQTAVTAVLVPEPTDDTASQDGISDAGARTPPAKSSIIGSSVPSTPSAGHVTPVSVPAHPFAAASAAPAASPAPNSARGAAENAAATVAIPSSPAPPINPAKDEDTTGLPGHRTSSSLGDAGMARGIGRGLTSQLAVSTPLTSGAVPSNGSLGAVPLVSDVTKRNILGTDDRIGNSGMGQPLSSPLSNRMILSQTGKPNDGTALDSANEGAGLGGRVFSPPAVPGMQWRPGSSFQNPNEPGQVRARTEIAPDQREKFLQRFQQVQQGHGNLLGMPSLPGGAHKQFPTQQNPLLQQQYNSQNSSLSSQATLGLSAQAPGFNNPTSATLQQPSSIHQQSSQPDAGHSKIDEQQPSQHLPDDSASESAPMAGLGMGLTGDDELKAPHTTDAVSSSLSEPVQVPRDTDFSPGQPIQSTQQPSSGLGVIGRRSVADLGAIGDNPPAPVASPGPVHDNSYNLQILEAAYHKLPQPKDSERARSYMPRHPTVTPSCYPQVQAPIVNSPGFWERLAQDSYGTDTLFFAFYYQQNTYQQYLAARELKKGSWRYHRKYNTWFQRHEEPKVATDEYEQGTYVYFDFHIANDDHQHGWCQRIKTEFTFEYNYLEDELIV